MQMSGGMLNNGGTYLGTDLVTALAGLDVNDFSHVGVVVGSKQKKTNKIKDDRW